MQAVVVPHIDVLAAFCGVLLHAVHLQLVALFIWQEDEGFGPSSVGAERLLLQQLPISAACG